MVLVHGSRICSPDEVGSWPCSGWSAGSGDATDVLAAETPDRGIDGVAVQFMAVLVNPQFASSQQSVGADLQRCNDFAFASQGAVALPAPECCNVIVNVIAVLPSCEEPTPVPPTVTLVPPRKQVPIPGPIVGPTWLGPIAPTSSTGLITLKVPPLLGIFFGQTNEVVVTNATGDIVYKGNLATNRLMVLSAPRAGGSGNYTVQTTLITGPKYTEVVSVTG